MRTDLLVITYKLQRRLVVRAGCVFSLCVLLYSGLAAAKGGQPQLPTVELGIGDQTLVVEVASNSEQRYNGLSYRTTLGTNEGMLFVYKRPRELIFTCLLYTSPSPRDRG